MNTQTEAVNRPSEDLFTTYEVTPEHRCVNEQGKTSREILNAIKAEIDPALLECLDYDSADSSYGSGSEPIYTRYIPGSRVIVYTVRGGSEGFYLHVDMINQGQIKNLILMKTLEGPENIKKLERAVWDIVALE